MSNGNFLLINNENYPEIASTSFQSHFENDLYVDLIFVCRNNEKVGAHQVVLGCLSKFLHNILDNSLNTAALEKIVHIYVPDIRAKTMKSILQFIYTGKTTLNEDELNEFEEDIKLLGFHIFSPPKENPDNVKPASVTRKMASNVKIIRNNADSSKQNRIDDFSQFDDDSNEVETRNVVEKRFNTHSCILCGSNKMKKCFYASFPKNLKRCEFWLEKCGLPVTTDVKNAKLCELHFTDSDFTQFRTDKIFEQKRLRLKKDAYPSLFSVANISKEVQVQSFKKRKSNTRSCLICGHTSEKVSFFRIPKNEDECKKWSDYFRLDLSQLLTANFRICSKHFAVDDGNLHRRRRKILLEKSKLSKVHRGEYIL